MTLGEMDKLFTQAMTLLKTVDLRELSEMYAEQAKLLTKIQLLLDSLTEYTEELQKELPGEDIPETSNPFRVEWEYSNGLLKIVIPGHLPKLNYYSKDWRTVRDDIIKRLFHGLKDLPSEVKFRRAYCIVKMYYCLKHNWDVQNRAYQAILNVLAMKNILPNDSVDHVVTVLAGKQIEKGQEERTEVYLFEVEDFEIHRHLFQQV